MSYSNIHFILYKPQLPENIGACARALKNFNFNKLKIISPKKKYPNEKVFATSVGAKDIINSSKVYSNFEDAISDIDCVIMTSSRIRKKNYKYLSISELNKIDFKKKIAIVFGPESSGLSNNELSYANYVVKLPTNNNFKSLNISHCLILFCYEIFKVLNKKFKKIYVKDKSNRINKKDLNKFINHLVLSLDQVGFLQPDHKRKSMVQNVRAIFHKINLSDKEMRTLMGIFSTLKQKKGSLTNQV